MGYTNSFASELDRVATRPNSMELPREVYDYIKAKIMEEAERQCNWYLSGLKAKAAKGEYTYANGRRVITDTWELRPKITILNSSCRDSSTTYWLNRLSTYINANTLRANGICRENYEGLVTYEVDLFKNKNECKDKFTLYGHKKIYSFDIQKGPFADIYFNTIKDILRKNGIGYRLVLEFAQGKTALRKSFTVKKQDITSSIPHIYESFETPWTENRLKQDSFSVKMAVETTVYF